MTSADVPIIFDPQRRAARRNRARPDAFLIQHIAAEMTERLDLVDRTFTRALVIGPVAHHLPRLFGRQAPQVTIVSPGAREAAALGGICAVEDRLPFAPGSFDLVLAGGTLDSVADLPGALIQIRRALVPDGLMLATLFGAGSLASLRRALLAAGPPVARLHPQIALRDAGDLLLRTGFTLPVADEEVLTVRYRALDRLVGDLRAAGVGNALAGPIHRFDRVTRGRLIDAWHRLGDDAGRVSETFCFLHLSGWAPAVQGVR